MANKSKRHLLSRIIETLFWLPAKYSELYQAAPTASVEKAGQKMNNRWNTSAPARAQMCKINALWISPVAIDCR